jgi:hypothetical protein
MAARNAIGTADTIDSPGIDESPPWWSVRAARPGSEGRAGIDNHQ